MKKLYPLILLLLVSVAGRAVTLKVLFIGNSYTYYNNMPDIVKDLAFAGGDNLVHSSSAPGGHTLQQHCSNAQTLSLISQGGWDYVVLQEQSQLPSFPDGQVASSVYPYARKLDSLVHAYSPCAKTVFYMTWGRQNGDAQNCAGWPPVCTYIGMDSLLQLRYLNMMTANHAWVSPVAKVWRRLRQLNPSINLYDADGSHPSQAGSFAVACSFYALLYGKNPENLSYNFTLGAADAAAVKAAAKAIVLDSLTYWKAASPMPIPAFTAQLSGNTVQLTNTSQNAYAYNWSFGDNTFSTATAPSHTYTANGTYTITLKASRCKDTVSATRTVTITTAGVPVATVGKPRLYPNPAGAQLTAVCHYGPASVRVTDLSGRELYLPFVIAGNEVQLSTAALAPGMYFLWLGYRSGAAETLSFVRQ